MTQCVKVDQGHIVSNGGGGRWTGGGWGRCKNKGTSL